MDWFWSPRVLAYFFGSLGLFALVGFIAGQLVGGVVFHPVHVLYVAQGVLMVASAAFLWSSDARGWWLAWTAMLVIASSGLMLQLNSSHVGPEFMISGSAVFFCGIAHPNVYGACFPSTGPHTAFAATPAGLLLVAPLVSLFADAQRTVLVFFPLIACFIIARWVFSPLVALARGNKHWHPPGQNAGNDGAAA